MSLTKRFVALCVSQHECCTGQVQVQKMIELGPNIVTCPTVKNEQCRTGLREWNRNPFALAFYKQMGWCHFIREAAL